jgi:hypothetical protein
MNARTILLLVASMSAASTAPGSEDALLELHRPVQASDDVLLGRIVETREVVRWEASGTAPRIEHKVEVVEVIFGAARKGSQIVMKSNRDLLEAGQSYLLMLTRMKDGSYELNLSPAPKHEGPRGPESPNPLSTGDSWLRIAPWSASSLLFPSSLPVSITNVDDPGCRRPYQGYEPGAVWFTLQDFRRVAWGSITPKDYQDYEALARRPCEFEDIPAPFCHSCESFPVARIEQVSCAGERDRMKVVVTRVPGPELSFILKASGLPRGVKLPARLVVGIPSEPRGRVSFFAVPDSEQRWVSGRSFELDVEVDPYVGFYLEEPVDGGVRGPRKGRLQTRLSSISNFDVDMTCEMKLAEK